MDISHVIPYFSYVKPKTLITSNAKASYKRRNVKINQWQTGKPSEVCGKFLKTGNYHMKCFQILY